MAKNAKISIKIGAQDMGTKPVIDKAKNNLDSLGNSAQRSAKKFSSSLNAMKATTIAATGILVSKISSMAINFATTTDAIAKNSRAIGLSAESYQKLTYAADRQGVSSEQMYTSMKKFSQSMGQIKTGVGGMTSALQKSNPALLAQLKGAKNNEEAFLMAADAIKALPDASQRAALSMQIFGKSGVELNKVFEAGSEGIKTLMDEKEKYGVVSTESAAKSEAFIDSITKLKAAGQGLGQTIMATIIPAITPMIEATAEWVARNKPLFSGLTKMLIVVMKITPYVLAAVLAYMATIKAFQLYHKAIKIWSLTTKIATGIAAAFNGVMAVNPISLIALAVAGAVVAITLLIKHFDKVLAVVKIVGKAIADLFNPENWIKAFKAIGAGLKEFFLNPLQTIKKGFESIWLFTKKILGLSKGGKGELAGEDLQAPEVENTPLLAAQQDAKLNEARYISETTRNTSIDVNFNNMPKGVAVEQTQPVAGIKLNLGYAGS